MYKSKTIQAMRNNYGTKRNTSDIRYLVIHYTGNAGDLAENNGKYFKNNLVKASAHYFVDDTTVVQSVPDHYVAWSVGGKKYPDADQTGGGRLYGKATNANTLNIELCGTAGSGKAQPSAKTITNALTLTKSLMNKYNIPQARVIRHFDVTGKSCPVYWCGSTAKDKKWKSAFWNKLKTEAKTTSTADMASKASSTRKTYSGTFPVLPAKGYLAKGDKGTQVKRLQSFLNWYGSYGIAVDSSFGPATQLAVKRFQEAAGLKMDGSFGPATLAKAKTVKK